MNCKWQIIDGTTDGRGWVKTKCSRCGHVANPWPALEPGHVHQRACPVPGWGDYVAHFLVVVFGIDKNRFTSWVRLIRPQAKGCGCGQRQDVVNEAGWWVTSARQKLRSWLTGKSLPQ